MGKDGLGGDLGGPTDLEKTITHTRTIDYYYEVGRVTPLGYTTMGRFKSKEKAQKLLDDWNSEHTGLDSAHLSKVKFDD